MRELVAPRDPDDVDDVRVEVACARVAHALNLFVAVKEAEIKAAAKAAAKVPGV